ncbi:hypothetical protein ACOMHN_039601 [Nucella lapillus]
MAMQQPKVPVNAVMHIDKKTLVLVYETEDRTLAINGVSVRVTSPIPENIQFHLDTERYSHQSGVIPLAEIGNLTIQSVNLVRGNVKATFKSDRVINARVIGLFLGVEVLPNA